MSDMFLLLQLKDGVYQSQTDHFHDTEDTLNDEYFDENWDDEGKYLYEWSQKLSIEAVGQHSP